jgi:hypothetical protein
MLSGYNMAFYLIATTIGLVVVSFGYIFLGPIRKFQKPLSVYPKAMTLTCIPQFGELVFNTGFCGKIDTVDVAAIMSNLITGILAKSSITTM